MTVAGREADRIEVEVAEILARVRELGLDTQRPAVEEVAHAGADPVQAVEAHAGAELMVVRRIGLCRRPLGGGGEDGGIQERPWCLLLEERGGSEHRRLFCAGGRGDTQHERGAYHQNRLHLRSSMHNPSRVSVWL